MIACRCYLVQIMNRISNLIIARTISFPKKEPLIYSRRAAVHMLL